MSLALWQRRLRSVLSPAGLAYAGVMHARRRLFEADRLLRWTAPRPVVSVGNIRMGGSGKTPLIRWLLDWALARGLKPVVLTRGYRARPPRLPYLVHPDSPPSEAGDEPLMLTQSCPGAAIIVDPRRFRAGMWAMENLQPDLFLLDDGFQHLAVARQADLVLLTAEDLGSGWNRVFPAGMWREGASALASATAFLVKADAEEFDCLKPLLNKAITGLPRPVFPLQLRATSLKNMDGDTAPDLKNRPYILASAVADPSGVEQTARGLLGDFAGHLALGDHASFSPRQRANLLSLARRASVSDIVCTAKDVVKLRSNARELSSFHLWFLETEIEFAPGLGTNDTFAEYWERLWASLLNQS